MSDYEIISSKIIQKTRKDHFCVWCGDRIDKGSRAECDTLAGEGTLGKQYWHPECIGALNAAHKEFRYDIMDIGFAPGEFQRGAIDLK